MTVFAPASIGNVSVGFDLLGAAISPIDGTLLGDKVSVCENDKDVFSLHCCGDFVNKLPSEMEQNIVYQCYLIFCQQMSVLKKPIRSLSMTLEKNMPIGSGLGSSACSIVAALDALNQFHENPLDKNQLLSLMGEMEARISGSLHYDNVAPSYLGGMQLMVEDKDIICQPLPTFDSWLWIMAYPGVNVSTAQARAILPAQYRRQDVIEHARHLSSFIYGCFSNIPSLAAHSLIDIVAEPYREKLLPGFAKAREFAAQAGALATGISGSGSTIFSISDDVEVAKRIAKWLQDNYLQNETGFVHICQLDKQGSIVMRDL